MLPLLLLLVSPPLCRLFSGYILALHAHVQNCSSSSSSSSRGRLLRHQQSMPQQQMADLYRQTFCCPVPQCQQGGLGLSSSLKTLVMAAVGLLLRVLLWVALLLVRLVLLPLAAMAVLARQHSGLWWALLLHSAWLLGEQSKCAALGIANHTAVACIT
jgi:hypothetical protein